MKDLPVPWPRQGTLPKSPPAPSQFSLHEVVSVEEMGLLSTSPKASLVTFSTTNIGNSPQNNGELCGQQRSTFQGINAGSNNEEDLEPIPLCNLPFHALDNEKSWPNDTRSFASPDAWNFGVDHKSTNNMMPNSGSF